MNIKEGNIIEIWNENIKVITPVTFINGNEIIFFVENLYNIQTKNLKIKFEYSTHHIYSNCKIKKVGRRKLKTELAKSLMDWGSISPSPIIPYLIHQYQTYIRLKKLLKNNMMYLKYFLYKLKEQDFYNVVNH
jgi:hypothetical protein